MLPIRQCLVMVFACALPAVARAQDMAGHLEGFVADSAGQPVAGADVRVSGTGLPLGRVARSDGRGFYRFDQLPIGVYAVHVRSIGLRPVVIRDVTVRLGRTTAAGTARLAPTDLQLTEITVTAERPLLDPSSAAGGANLVAERFDLVPFERSYRSLTEAVPGANPEVEGVNINGGTGYDNLWFIDGVGVTNPLNGSSSMLIPYNFVKEVEVRSGGYEAEYRGALGGVVNVVTHSGSDTFRFQTFGYFLNNSLYGNNRVIGGEEPPGRFARFDIGGSAGGPLLRRRLWFFAAYAPSFERQDVQLARHGTFRDRRVTHSLAGKITWQPSARVTLVGTIVGDPGTRDAVEGSPAESLASVDPWLSRVSLGGTALSASLTHAWSSTTTLSATITRRTMLEAMRPATSAGDAFNYTDSNGVAAGGTVWKMRYEHALSDARASLSWVRGAHQLKAGLDVSDITLRLQDRWGGIRQLRYAEDSVNRYEWADFYMRGRVRSRIYGFFVQDGWHVTTRLRLNAGVRWDGERHYGSDGGLAVSITNELQPRLGFVWQADGAGRSRVFGSYGRYYEHLLTSLASFYLTYGTYARINRYPQDPRIDTTGGSCHLFCIEVARVPDPGLEGQSLDEWTLGYERALTGRLKLAARALHRQLRWGIEDAVDRGFGNPGRGALVSLPRMKREYSALELSVAGDVNPRLWLMASLVLSRSYGNYPGLYDSDHGYTNSNWSAPFDAPNVLVNSSGRLPNDRPQVLKATGSYRVRDNLVLGGSLRYESGRPLSELGIDNDGWETFVYQRGTAGRAPALWDLAARVTWSPRDVGAGRPSIVFDMYHIGSPRRARTFNELRWFGRDVDDNPVGLNPEYRQPTSFQPPMSARLGIVFEF